ncbi:MAG: FadR family transcriptional regulator [Actinobacteria bacterium]|nr:FadR family transcriptional regulator [Actinomycetota bacterium]
MASRPPIALDVHAGDVRPLKTAEVVARRIVQAILDDGLGSGAQLPAEARMMELYDVSRESLREALRLLEVQGFIVIRRGPGGGPVVGSVDPAAFARMASMYFQMAGVTYDELYAAWSSAEVLLAELAARHPDAARRAELMAPFQVEGPLDQTSPMVEHADLHAALAALTGNRALEISMQLFSQIVTHHGVSETDAEGRAMVFEDHAELAGAVRGGHPQLARKLMEGHCERVVERMRMRTDTAGDRIVAWL